AEVGGAVVAAPAEAAGGRPPHRAGPASARPPGAGLSAAARPRPLLVSPRLLRVGGRGAVALHSCPLRAPRPPCCSPPAPGWEEGLTGRGRFPPSLHTSTIFEYMKVAGWPV